jgi:5'-nucleotidase
VLVPAIERARELKARPLGVVLETPVRRQRGNESPLGNLVTDALRSSVAGADVALHNISGGLRADLPPGPLTYGSVFEVMPFDNRVVQLRVTGRDLRRMFAAQLQRGTIVGISGIRVVGECAGDTLRVALHRPSGALVSDDERLVAVTIDFLATAGDGLLAPLVPMPDFTIPDNAPQSREVVVEYLTRRGGRLNEEQLIDNRNPRWTFPASLPVTCRAR